jgi:hypothetical protein
VRHFEVPGEILENCGLPRIDAVAGEETIVDRRPRLGLEVSRGDIEHVLEVFFDFEPGHHRLGVPPRAIGENKLTSAEPSDRGAKRRVGCQRRMIDLVHDFQKLVGVKTVLLHQAAHAGAVALVIVLLHPERFVGRNFKKVCDVVADALIDLLPEIEMVWIERVIEIEYPGLDGIEVANSVADLVLDLAVNHSGDSLLPHFAARRL